ncbi:MAG TPA: DUF2218 domain-containing protein [Gammaproteobacteria bacterium]|jgi:hypothetical protein|nr:DUF2218 domain-containing protein [Gammaproteobacteria bacterium]
MIYQTRTRVVTNRGKTYIRQLCRHFSRKVPAEWKEDWGKSELPGGPVTMHADDESISFVVQSSTQEGLSQSQHIIEDHLIRFARKDHLAPIIWQPMGSTQETPTQ